MRALVLPLAAIVLGVFLAGCDPGLELRIDNQTDQSICFTDSLDSPHEFPICFEVEPGSHTYGLLCQQNDTLFVTLTTVGRLLLFSSFATCREWEDSGAWIEVTKRNEEYEVRDSLTFDE